MDRAYPFCGRRGFTLTEWLVVLGVLAVLTGIFVPALARSREMNQRTRCMDNLRRISEALRQYGAMNRNELPRVIYDSKRNPNGHAAFTGADSPDPFAADSAVAPNDVTASLFLLVRYGLARADSFVCASTDDVVDSLATGTSALKRSNFSQALNLSYSFATPFSNAIDYRNDDLRPADFAVLADRNPGGAATRIAWNVPPLELQPANSPNHKGAGQNALFADGSVRFVTTPYCGVGNDNIYTALVADPLKGERPSPDGVGVQGPAVGPAWAYDTFLVPIREK